MRIRIVETVVAGVLAAIYYILCTPPLLLWTVDRLATALSLAVGPALAILWLAAEVVFFLVPFIAIRLWASRLKRSGLNAALGALAAFWLTSLVPVLGALAFGVPIPPFVGIGGAASSWPVFAADLAASAIGLGIVLVAGSSRELPLNPAVTH